MHYIMEMIYSLLNLFLNIKQKVCLRTIFLKEQLH